jgi:hypothetical protein
VQRYDLVYSSRITKKNQKKLSLLLTKSPQSKTILTLAVNIEHHKYLKDSFAIDGIDLNEKFIKIARQKTRRVPHCC